MTADAFLRRSHRVIAVGFLLSIFPAGYFSFQGDAQSPFVYIPLLFLLGLTISGTYLLVQPWIQKRRARRLASAPAGTTTKP